MATDTKTQGPSRLQRVSDAVEAGIEAPAPAAAPSGGMDLPEIDQSTVGVVFVHGIGEQVRAEILLGWSGAIVQAVREWAASRAPEPDGIRPWSDDRVVRSEIDFESSALPLVTIRVPGTHEGTETFTPQTWVMTEARWAQDVRPPTLETMIDWCGPRGVVAAVVGRIVVQGMKSSAREQEARAVAAGQPVASVATQASPTHQFERALAEMGLSTFISVVVTAGLLGYAVLRTVAGLVPWKPLHDALDRITLDQFLTTWWGDVYVLLDDPVQAANIRGQVARSIRALRAFGCQRIVVVAHSGGTIVSYMTLSDPALTESADTLVTHGQAIQMARAIYRSEGESPSSPARRLALGTRLRGVTRWRDLHATHDPAPSGSLAEAEPGHAPPGTDFCDTEVWNRMSIAADHGGYLANDEEFVEGLLAEIETAGRPGARSRFLAGADARILRRHQRVYILALWNRLMFVLPLIAIMAAFLLPSTGLIPALRDAAGSIVSFVPGSTELIGAIARALPGPGNHDAVVISAGVVATFYLFAIAKAIVPIGRTTMWTGARWWFFFFLDFGVFMTGVALAWFVRASVSGDPLAAFRDLIGRLVGDPSVLGALVASASVVVGLGIPPLRHAVSDTGGAHLRTTRLAVLVVAMALLGLAAYGIVVDASIRMVVSATVIALLPFQLLGKIGTWRWERWDDIERAVARQRRPQAYRRRWIWFQFLTLGAIGAIVAVAIVVGSPDLLVLAAEATAALLAILVVTDVAGRRETGGAG